MNELLAKTLTEEQKLRWLVSATQYELHDELRAAQNAINRAAGAYRKAKDAGAPDTETIPLWDEFYAAEMRLALATHEQEKRLQCNYVLRQVRVDDETYKQLGGIK